MTKLPGRFVTLVLLAGCAGAEQAPERSRIPEWIAELGADNVETREAATERLIQEGARATAALNDALQRGDPEVRLRAAHILDRIRWDAFPGGEAQAGFKMSLQMEKELVRKGDTIRLELQLRNVQAVGQKIPRIVTLAWDTVRCEGRHPDAQAFLVLRQVAGLPQKKSLHFANLGSGKPYISLRPLAAGESLDYTFLFVWSNGGLQDHCDARQLVEFPENLNPGAYEAYVLYFARSKDLLPGALQDLKSNVIRFRVMEQ